MGRYRASMENPPTPAPWSLGRRIAFRFACVYFLLYSFPQPLQALFGASFLPGWATYPWEKLSGWYDTGSNAFYIWVGRVFFHVEIKIVPTGSGDTQLAFVQLPTMLVLAALGALIWSYLARNATEHARAYDRLRVFLRYVVAVTMLGYGLYKVFPLQFGTPRLDRLMEPYGESSPMGILWTFMAASVPYTFFGGFMEALGGVLLFCRRTTTLGALVAIAVMSNVVMLNFCYDVPVKLYSAHILLMAAILVLPDAERLLNVLVLNRPTTPLALAAPPVGPRWRIARVVIKYLFVLGACASQIVTCMKDARMNVQKHALYGVYEVEEYTRNGTLEEPQLSSTTRWKKVSVNEFGGMWVRTMDDSKSFLRGMTDEKTKAITFIRAKEKADPDTLTVARPDDEHLVLEGKLGEDALVVKLKKLPLPEFLLTTRGFHWIQEFPYNR
jgi:hypothetical protein